MREHLRLTLLRCFKTVEPMFSLSRASNSFASTALETLIGRCFKSYATRVAG